MKTAKEYTEKDLKIGVLLTNVIYTEKIVFIKNGEFVTEDVSSGGLTVWGSAKEFKTSGYVLFRHS